TRGPQLAERWGSGYSSLQSFVALADTLTVPRPRAGTEESSKMLVLTRKLGENIRIGDSIKITVLEAGYGQVKLGIDAPPEVKVHRQEIDAPIQEENRRAQDRKAEGSTPPRENAGSERSRRCLAAEIARASPGALESARGIAIRCATRGSRSTPRRF